MKLCMKRPKLPTDCLTTNLDEDITLDVEPDGTMKGTDDQLLSNDVTFLKEVIASLVELVEKK